MDRDELLQQVTDALCGELDREGEAKLRAALDADPALAVEAAHLVRVWHRIGKILDEDQPGEAVLTRVYAAIIRQRPAELSDEDLDMAAGGMMPDDAPWRGGKERDPEHK